MLKRFFARLLGRTGRRAVPTPADPAFWIRVGHPPARAEEIAACFPEYWTTVPSAHARIYARYALARQVGDTPLHWTQVYSPQYASRESLPEIDPFHWCRVQRYDLYPFAEAVEIAQRAAKIFSGLRLSRFRHHWLAKSQHSVNFERKRFQFSPNRTPLQPNFWRQLGHNPLHARRLVRCAPEFWFRHKKCPWRYAVAHARHWLETLARRLSQADHHFYDLAESPHYDIQHRDPVYWFLQGQDWDQASREAIRSACPQLPTGCERMFQLRDMVRRAGAKAELLHDRAIYVSGPLLGVQTYYEKAQARRKQKALSAGTTPAAAPRWGPLELDSPSAAYAHYCALGTAESGKEILLRILLHSVASDRWLVWDGNNHLLPALHTLHPAKQVFLLNPLDARSYAWNIAEDAASPQQIQELVAALLPADPRHDPVLTQTTRMLLEAILQSLNHTAPDRWSLVHLLAALEPENIRVVLLSDRADSRTARALLHHPQIDLLISLLQSRLFPLKPTAAAWQYASERIGIATWLRSPAALYLGNSLRSQHVLEPLNRVLFHLIAGSLLEPRAPTPTRTWVFLADLCRLGRLEPLAALLARGSAANVTVVITLDDLEMLQRHYGAEATALLALCRNFAFLKIANPVTARWVSQAMGMQKLLMIHESQGTLSGKTSRSRTFTPAERPLIAPTDLQQLPPLSGGRGPGAYFKTLQHHPYRGVVDLPKSLEHQWLREIPSDVPAFEPCPEEYLQFPREASSLLAELGFTPAASTPRTSPRRRRTQKPQDKPFPEGDNAPPPKREDFNPDDFPRLDEFSE